jgi:WhiB family redox-sensing transcriptional regulator
VAIRASEDTWQARGACRGPQAMVFFFPPAQAERKQERIHREARAKAICSTCAVRRDCLAYAIRIHEPHGIWGGMNEAERRKLSERASR